MKNKDFSHMNSSVILAGKMRDFHSRDASSNLARNQLRDLLAQRKSVALKMLRYQDQHLDGSLFLIHKKITDE
jgi:hypothetical protein